MGRGLRGTIPNLSDKVLDKTKNIGPKVPLGQSHGICDAPLGSTKQNRECYMAYRDGTAPILLTRNNPTLFEFHHVTGTKDPATYVAFGVVDQNPVIEKHWAFDAVNKIIRQRPRGGTQVMEVQFFPPLYCEWVGR